MGCRDPACPNGVTMYRKPFTQLAKRRKDKRSDPSLVARMERGCRPGSPAPPSWSQRIDRPLV